MSRSGDTGKAGETAVCDYLGKKGCCILERNYRISGGEVDIIAAMGEEILFVEVKTRRMGAMISGCEAITERKKKLLIRAAMQYCTEHIIDLQPRFDVAAVCMSNGRVQEINYLENAFDLSDSDSIF
ncbi:MAG: YraN family protein [Ruminococcus sp.]|nr:YraN family protein [Ruminococcus sp.]